MPPFIMSRRLKIWLTVWVLKFYIISPDYNPIYFKYYLKDHEDLIQTLSSPNAVIESALDNVTSAMGGSMIASI